jgi:hypothetical protein
MKNLTNHNATPSHNNTDNLAADSIVAMADELKEIAAAIHDNAGNAKIVDRLSRDGRALLATINQKAYYLGVLS